MEKGERLGSRLRYGGGDRGKKKDSRNVSSVMSAKNRSRYRWTTSGQKSAARPRDLWLRERGPPKPNGTPEASVRNSTVVRDKREGEEVSGRPRGAPLKGPRQARGKTEKR